MNTGWWANVRGPYCCPVMLREGGIWVPAEKIRPWGRRAVLHLRWETTVLTSQNHPVMKWASFRGSELPPLGRGKQLIESVPWGGQDMSHLSSKTSSYWESSFLKGRASQCKESSGGRPCYVWKLFVKEWAKCYFRFTRRFFFNWGIVDLWCFRYTAKWVTYTY